MYIIGYCHHTMHRPLIYQLDDVTIHILTMSIMEVSQIILSILNPLKFPTNLNSSIRNNTRNWCVNCV